MDGNSALEFVNIAICAVVALLILGIGILAYSKKLAKRKNIKSDSSDLAQTSNSISKIGLFVGIALFIVGGLSNYIKHKPTSVKEYLKPPAQPVVLRSFQNRSQSIKSFPIGTVDEFEYHPSTNTFDWTKSFNRKVLRRQQGINPTVAKSLYENALNTYPAWQFVLHRRKLILPSTVPKIDSQKALELQKQYRLHVMF